MPTQDNDRIVCGLDNKSAKIANATWTLLHRQNGLDAVANALNRGSLKTQRGKIMALNFMSCYGAKTRKFISIYEKHMNIRHPHVLSCALLALTCLKSRDSLPKIQALLNEPSIREEAKDMLARAASSIVNEDPKLFSPHYGAQHIWSGTNQTPAFSC